jgi:hypothetical protein
LKRICDLCGSITNHCGGIQFVFKNSDIICHYGSYGSKDLLWEIMPDPDTLGDVLGYLTLDKASREFAVNKIRNVL